MECACQGHQEKGVTDAILIFKEMDGRVYIHEGNHRLRAAVAAHLASVPVEVRYFGNSQRSGLVLDPETGKCLSGKRKKTYERRPETPDPLEVDKLLSATRAAATRPATAAFCS